MTLDHSDTSIRPVAPAPYLAPATLPPSGRSDLPMPGARTLVIGLGRSGIAAARVLRRLGCEVTVSEARTAAEIGEDLVGRLTGEGIAVETGGHREESFLSQDWIVVSPGVATDKPWVREAGKRRIPVIGELELGARLCETPIIAITGTNGKSTVTTLIGSLLTSAGRKTFVGGNLGTPLCEYILEGEGADFAVCEVSSFQLDTAPHFRPAIGVLLNITPDHLDRYDSFAHYGDAKMAVFANQTSDDVAIVNLDDHEIGVRLDRMPQVTVCGYRSDDDGKCHGYIQNGRAVVRPLASEVEERYDLASTVLAQPPNRENALAAILAARAAGCHPEAITAGLSAYTVLSHRMTPAGRIGGVEYIDDSKATNIGATAAALAGIETPVILIAGGRDKGGDYALLTDSVRRKVRVMLLIGEARDKIAAALQEATRIEMMATLETAVERAAELAVPGETVLLSPACSSFDMFTSYAERGRIFQAAVQDLNL